MVWRKLSFSGVNFSFQQNFLCSVEEQVVNKVNGGYWKGSGKDDVEH